MTEPFAGDFILASNETVRIFQSVATSDLALTSTVTDVPGTSMTVTALTDEAKYLAFVSVRFDKDSPSSSSAFAICRLNVDGSDEAGQIVARNNLAAVATHHAAKTFTGELSAGSHTFKLRGSCSSSSIWTIDGQTSDTNLIVVVYR